MLPSADLKTAELPFLALEPAAGLALRGMPASGEVPAGFAELLGQAQPGATPEIAVDGEALPAAGKALPEQIELPLPELPATDTGATAIPVPEALPPLVAEPVLSRQRPDTPVTEEAPASGALLPPAADLQRHEELATLAAMLPPLATPSGPQAPPTVLPAVAPLRATLRDVAALGRPVTGASPLAVAQPLPAAANERLPVGGRVDPRIEPLIPAEPAAPEALAPRPVTATASAPVATSAPAIDFDALLQSAAGLNAEPRADGAESLPRFTAMPSVSSLTGTALPATSGATATATPTAPVNVPVGEAGWANAIGDRVLWMTTQKIQTAEIRLNPVELGPLTVEVKMDDGNAQVTIAAQHAATRDALLEAMPRLKELFSGEGLNLSQADVTEKGVSQERDERRAAGLAGEDGVRPEDDEPDAGQPPAARVSDGLVDTFA